MILTPLDVVEQSIDPVLEDRIVHNRLLVEVHELQLAACGSLSSQVEGGSGLVNAICHSDPHRRCCSRVVPLVIAEATLCHTAGASVEEISLVEAKLKVPLPFEVNHGLDFNISLMSALCGCSDRVFFLTMSGGLASDNAVIALTHTL